MLKKSKSKIKRRNTEPALPNNQEGGGASQKRDPQGRLVAMKSDETNQVWAQITLPPSLLPAINPNQPSYTSRCFQCIDIWSFKEQKGSLFENVSWWLNKRINHVKIYKNLNTFLTATFTLNMFQSNWVRNHHVKINTCSITFKKAGSAY